MQLWEHNTASGQLFGQWTSGLAGALGRGTKFPTGEVGILRNVRFHPAQGSMPRRLVLEVEHDGGQFTKALNPKDDDFTERLYKKLIECKGKSMQEIGSLDIDH